MHLKSSFTYLRLTMLAMAGLSAIALALPVGLHKSGSAATGQGQTTIGTKDLSRQAGSRGDSKAAAFLSQPSVKSSLEEIKLTDPDGVEEDAFGTTVAISGTTAVVGTVEEEVHVFVQRDDVWELQQTLPAPMNTDNDGQPRAIPVAIDKDTIVAGAFAIAYVYVRTGTTWSLQTSLISPVSTEDPFYGGSFGQDVGVSGNTIIVGASGVDDQAGAVYFYDRSGTNWSGPVKLSADDHSPGPMRDLFGWSVAIDGDTVVVGAPNQDVVDNGIHDEGAAYVYVRSLGEWVEQGYLIPDENQIGSTFYMGDAVALSGDTAVVSASHSERVFVFAREGTSWTGQQVLGASDGQSLDWFGSSVATSGETIVIGTYRQEDFLGAAYVFDRIGTTWFQREKLTVSNGEPTPFSGFAFGRGVSISGGKIIVGAPNEQIEGNDFQGAAYIFQKLDSDGDALADDWEEEGITVADNGRVIGTGNLEGEGTFIDLPQMGADPMHKDLFIHVDWMERGSVQDFRPSPRAIALVIDAFATAPVTNPDLEPGINLHVDLGPDSVMKYVDGEPETWGDLSEAGEVPYQAVIEDVGKDPPYDWPTVDAVKMDRFTPANRKSIFHYALYCNSYRKPGDPPEKERRGGTSRGAPGADFLLAIGSRPPNGEPIREASLFMHEFGHNLGLLHGGGDDVNDKPNYISIMNYRFDLIGTLHPNGRQRYIDYSRATLDPLRENNLLSENIGINDPVMHLTTWNPRTRPDTPPGSNKCLQNPDFYYRLFYPSNALDWDCDGIQSSSPVTADINGDGELGVLTGFDDWPALVFEADGRIGRFASARANRSQRATASAQLSTLPDELTEEELEALVPPALLAEESLAPLDVVTLSLHTGAAPLPVNFDGSASTAVNGTIVDWQWDFGDGTTGSGATAAHTYTALGDYFVTLTVTDSNGRVNLVPLRNRVTVTGNQPNLTPYQPPAWSDKIIVSTVAGTNTDSADLTTSDALYIDLAIVNNGPGPTTGDFAAKLFVDGVEVQSFITNPPLFANSYTAAQDLAVGPLSAGQHTLTVVADASGVIAETDESDNEYSRVINITGATPTPSPSPTGQANLTSYQPPSWSDKIVVSNVTGTNADSATLNTTDTLYVDWAAINNGGAPTTGSFETKLFVDGVEKNARVTSVSINPGGSFGVQDLTVGSLSAGQHNIRVVLDSGGAITESDETDNEYTKTITVLSPLPTPSPTPTPLPVSQTYTVRNTNDSGPDSLRQAIIDANSHPNAGGGIDQIAFNIPGPGVHTITPATAYPAIADPVLIDGYTQPGTSPNTLVVGDDALLLVEINGVNISEDGLNFTGGNSTIRGLVINHFDSNLFSVAMRLGSSNNTVAGNFIGTNASGTTGVRNLISINIASGANNVIGGTRPADRNILGGSNNQNQPAAGAGVQIHTTQPGTRIQGNYIGTNAAGTAALGNGRGIDLVGSPSADVTIGGLTDTPGTGAGNVISGNSSNGGINSDGIFISNRPGDLRIQGNLIGLDATGTTAISNGVSGINFQDTTPGTSLLLVGGTEPGARNVVFNNRISGLFSNALGLIVQGNFIGTDITGTARPPLGAGSANRGDGILIGGGSVTIGGDSVAARNVISCIGRGLRLASGSTTLQGNYIGTTVDGSTPLGNQPAGILVHNDAVAIIGGTAPGQGNVIAHSFTAGIEVRNNARATILGNSIFDNGTQDLSTFQGHPGIDHNDNGVTPNDSCDTDSGPNGLQNFPTLTSAVASAGTIKFRGSLNSKPSTSFRIEFLSNPSCEASGHGEGQNYVGFTAITTDANCSASINVTLPAGVPVGQFVSATATDSDGNTSEFGPCVQVTAASPTAATTSVRGQITDTHGNSIAGVTISLGGTQNRQTISDDNGNYNFDNVETNRFYTVVPARANYLFVPAQRSFNALGSVTEAAFTATPTSGGLNPLDSTDYFVRQQYLDFLGREPDESGFGFWTNQIGACGYDETCLEARRVNTSAAFFLSIEFQRTGYELYRTYKTAYGDIPRAPIPLELEEFLSGTRQLGRGVVVNQVGWEQVLENNTATFMVAFVQGPRFRSVYPMELTPAQFVDRLFSNAGVTPAAGERVAAITEFGSTTTTSDEDARARALRRVAENATLARRELNRAFVLMQYFGYLRRNPVDAPESSLDYSGYNFWLEKLTRFDGNFVNAEMVKAFLLSGEYRQRFERK